MTMCRFRLCIIFFFNDTATTEIYTLSLHDALPICLGLYGNDLGDARDPLAQDSLDALLQGHRRDRAALAGAEQDRKSTRLNSSHANISYAVFCLKKKTNLH